MSSNMPSQSGPANTGSWSLSLPIRSRNPPGRFGISNQVQIEPSYTPETPETHDESEEVEESEESDVTSECWSDGSMEDEEEIIVRLNRRAMEMLPRRLQIIMSEIYAERYTRLKLENPGIRVMPEDYWITPLQPLGATPMVRAPTPLLAPPQRKISSNAYQDGFRDGYESGQSAYAQAQAYIHTFGPSNPRRWSAQVTPSQNAFATSHPVDVNFSRRQLRQTSQGVSQPENGFRVLNGYHRPLSSNLVFTQQHSDNAAIRGGSGLTSLSIKPVTSRLRKGIKRSLSRLNKWIKS